MKLRSGNSSLEEEIIAKYAESERLFMLGGFAYSLSCLDESIGARDIYIKMHHLAEMTDTVSKAAYTRGSMLVMLDFVFQVFTTLRVLNIPEVLTKYESLTLGDYDHIQNSIILYTPKGD